LNCPSRYRRDVRTGLFHDALGEAHETNKTPHLAVALSALITFFLPAAVSLSGINAFDAQGYFGTLCSFGFLLVYTLVSVAAPIYLRSLGQLSKVDFIFGPRMRSHAPPSFRRDRDTRKRFVSSARFPQ
jgi:amino acid transporter